MELDLEWAEPTPKAPRPATEAQLRVLRLIRDWKRQHGIAPSTREMASTLGIKSNNGIRDHITALEKKGLLTYSAMLSRSTVLTHAGYEALGDTMPGADSLPIVATAHHTPAAREGVEVRALRAENRRLRLLLEQLQNAIAKELA